MQAVAVEEDKGILHDGVSVTLSCVASAVLTDNGKEVNLNVPLVKKHIQESFSGTIAVHSASTSTAPGTSPPIVLQLQNQARVLVYPAGKLIAYDGPSEDDAKRAVMTACTIIKDSGYNVLASDPVVETIVAKFSVYSEIELEVMAIEDADNVTYEPEVYHGLLHHSQASEALPPGVNAFVYPFGDVIVSGCKSLDQVKAATSTILRVVRKYLTKK